MAGSPPLCQVAMSVTDLPRTHAWYTAAFGYQPCSGTNAFKGLLAEKVQGVTGARSSCWWLGDGQDFFQLELFQFERPAIRPLPEDWRPCDIGYSSMMLKVERFDETLARLAVLGSALCGPIVGTHGQRRVCVRDPEGVLLELFEADPLPGRGLLVDPAVPVLTLGVTVSVPSMADALAYFRDVLGLTDSELSLHTQQHEALWGLEGAMADRVVLRAGDSLIELVQYQQPLGRPLPDDYRISDQGLLNIALGFRSKKLFHATYQRCNDAAIRANWRPLNMAAWNVVYVNDSHGFSVELLQVQPWYDARMGFSPAAAAPNLAVQGLRSLTVAMPMAVDCHSALNALTEHEAMANWWIQSDVSLIQTGAPERNGVGAVRRMRGLGVTLEEEVTRFFPGRGYDYRLRAGAPIKDHAATVRVLPQGNTALVQWRIEFRPRIPGTGAVTQWALSLVIRHVLRRLKKQLERVAASAPPSH